MTDQTSEYREQLRDKIELKMLWLTHTLTKNEANNVYECIEALLHKSNQEARIDALERLKVLLAGFTWGPYDPYNIINEELKRLKADS